MSPSTRQPLHLLGPLLGVALAACGDDASATGSGGAGGSTSSTTSGATTTASTATSGGEGGGSGGQGEGGAAGGLPADCDGLAAAMITWLADHQSCSGEGSCQRLEEIIPSNAGICDPIASPGDDLDDLMALAAAWEALGCESEGSCGLTPGDAVCSDAGTCTLDTTDDCAACPNELDPVCTDDGQNAVNACWAAECLQARSWEPGYCPDSAQCVEAGGTCEESYFTAEPPCVDGLRWDPADVTAKGCAGGNLRNECCVPWEEPCSFVASSNTLSLDPFTCAAPTGEGVPWTCLHANAQDTCELEGRVEQPAGETYDADVVVTAGLGSNVNVVGTHANGSTFTCDGVVSFAFDVVSTWTCEACDAEGACTACEIDQTAYCAF